MAGRAAIVVAHERNIEQTREKHICSRSGYCVLDIYVADADASPLFSSNIVVLIDMLNNEYSTTEPHG
jgi:hypothetical protein